MERPSNLIIAFILAIAGSFFAFALGRIALFVFPNNDTEVEIESDFESQIDSEDYLALKQD
jgi:hypothetical protein